MRMRKFLNYVCAVLIVGIVSLSASLAFADQICWTMNDGWEDASFFLKLSVGGVEEGGVHYTVRGTLTIKFNTTDEPDVVELVNGNAELVDNEYLVYLTSCSVVTSSTKSELDQETILMRLAPQTLDGTYVRKSVLTGSDLSLQSYVYFDGVATRESCVDLLGTPAELTGE